MRIVFLTLIGFLLLTTSCDDGDLIVTTFEFDENTVLRTCQNQQNILVYAINENPNEAIAFNFTPPGATNEASISLNEYASINTTDRIQQTEIPLNANNKITYRMFNTAVEGNYFCQSIPPSEPRVTEQYTTTNGGKVIMTVTVIEDNEDSDADGIKDVDEIVNPTDDYRLVDTDGDGIPNYLDIDDDNDNVPTLTEIAIENTPTNENGYPDTDEDGIPNYLDNDDDNDGVLTRNEDLNAYEQGSIDAPILNPTDDDTNNDGIPNYLNPNIAISVSPPIEQSLPNRITRKFKVTFTAKNITMKKTNAEESISVETLNLGTYSFTNDVVIEPHTNEN